MAEAQEEHWWVREGVEENFRRTIGRLVFGTLGVWSWAGTEKLIFGVDVLDDDGVTRYAVEQDRQDVVNLVARLQRWLDG